jgi:hypothetical protein
MTQRFYRDWLKAFTEYASYGEAPLKMLFWTGVSTVAGALRRRVWIDQKFFQWVPNFYIIFVAPPGIVGKSTVSSIGMNLLREIKDITFGPDVVTWQALIETLAKSGQLVPDPSNPETLYPMSALTLECSEFGTFFNPDNSEMVDVLVSLWDGKRGSFKKVTKFSGSDEIENPWINIIACTTPAWIAGRFPEYLIGGGFTSRCVFLYADRKRQSVPYVDEAVPKMFNETRQRLIADLEQISMMFGEFQLADEARSWGRDWYDRHWKTASVLSTDQYAGYLARKQTHIHKLAMILSASKTSEMVISLDSLRTAEAMVTAVEQDMPKVFSRIGQNELTRGAATIVDLVHKSERVTKVELYKAMFRTMSYRDFELAISSAINSGQIEQRQEGTELILRKK